MDIVSCENYVEQRQVTPAEFFLENDHLKDDDIYGEWNKLVPWWVTGELYSERSKSAQMREPLQPPGANSVYALTIYLPNIHLNITNQSM
jgi:hypothetical protein